MTLLQQFGWNHFQSRTDILFDPSLLYGRVVSIQGFNYRLITNNGELDTELSGKLMFGRSEQELPKVGDWVTYLDYGAAGYIVDVLPRFGEVSRKRPGQANEKQVLAANIDGALIVQGLDRDYNLARLERYIVQLKSCAVTPIVVLNKADLVGALQEILKEVGERAHDAEVYVCAATDPGTLSPLTWRLSKPGETFVMIGSSGVGKSTLLNALILARVQQTNEVSEANAKGQHTTTRRDLFLLPMGSMLIDTPGMREFGVTPGDNNENLFPLIDQLARHCKFADCSHEGELRCAVIRALELGELQPGVYESYLKLQKEMKRFQIGVEDKKRMNKQFGRMTREAKNHRKKYKY